MGRMRDTTVTRDQSQRSRFNLARGAPTDARQRGLDHCSNIRRRGRYASHLLTYTEASLESNRTLSAASPEAADAPSRAKPAI